MSNNQNSVALVGEDAGVESIDISGALLKAAAVVAPINDFRYYLNYVVIDRSERGTNIVACCGHMLCIACISKEPAERVTYGFMPQALKSSLIKKNESYKLYFEDSRCFVRADWCDINAKKLDKYVPYQDVTPKSIDAGAQVSGGQFQTEYIRNGQSFVNAFYGVSNQKSATTEVIAYPSDSKQERPLGGVIVNHNWRSSSEEIGAIAVVMGMSFGDKKGILKVPAMFSEPLDAEDAKKGEE